MKNIFHIYFLCISICILSACSKVIDLQPESNVSVDNFYRNYTEVRTALTGVYNGLQKPLETEWMLTELRSDISKQGSPGSTSVSNIELNDLNTYLQNSSHPRVYDYWFYTYKNIRSANYVLRSLGVRYQEGATTFATEPTAVMDEEQRQRLAGEALFIRAYHYFNLTRLFGGVFILTEPQTPADLKKINRSSIADCFKFIEADLKAAIEWLPIQTYDEQPEADRGRVTLWAAKALLAKLYLTMDKKTDALSLLNDIIDRSGHALLASFEDVFSINNEMNREILFAVRYKAGGLGLGNFMANAFAPLNSGSAIVNGNGSGLNYPTLHLESRYIVPNTGFKDERKSVTIGRYNTLSYVQKFISQVMTRNDAENDFPVIRYSDVLLMKAEALGYSQESVDIINSIRKRAGAGVYPGSGNFSAAFYLYPDSGPEAITDSNFLDKLLLERRLEFAFENHRYFDLVRTGHFESAMDTYYEAEYDQHYRRFRPPLELDDLKKNIRIRPLLPIPQREIDTNNEIQIIQNPGY
jgi:SusD family.